ncbi:permease [Pseudomonas aeruginosa]|nr:permease [Pseudomonas aeruginosa]
MLLFGLLAASLWVLAPFWSALFWAAVLAFASWPLMRMLTRLLGGRESLAAGLLTLGWIVLVALPLVWLGFGLADNVRSLMELLKNLQVEGPAAAAFVDGRGAAGRRPPDRLVGFHRPSRAWRSSMYSSPTSARSATGCWRAARRSAAGSWSWCSVLILIFFFYRDGPRLESIVHRALERLIGNRAEHYRDLVAGTVQRVVNGVIGTAAAQALLAWIGFMIAGVPGAMLLGLLTFACSLLMVPPLVWGPATAWLFFKGDYGHGVFLGLWGFFIISGVDNILKPYLISRGGNLPLVVVLLGVFGGLLAFGFMGLFLGPILLAVAYNLLSDWIASTPRTPPAEGRGPDA